MTHWQRSSPHNSIHPVSELETQATETTTPNQDLLSKKRTPTADDDVLLTTAEVGRIVKLSDRTLERMRVMGTGPRFRKLGLGIRARVVYRMSDVREWVDRAVYQSTSEYDR